MIYTTEFFFSSNGYNEVTFCLEKLYLALTPAFQDLAHSSKALTSRRDFPRQKSAESTSRIFHVFLVVFFIVRFGFICCKASNTSAETSTLIFSKTLFLLSRWHSMATPFFVCLQSFVRWWQLSELGAWVFTCSTSGLLGVSVISNSLSSLLTPGRLAYIWSWCLSLFFTKFSLSLLGWA